MRQSLFLVSLLALSNSSSVTINSEIIKVFYSNLTTQNLCYRIPSLIQTSNFILLAFAEERDTCSDSANSRLVLRRSLNGGKSFSELITLYKPCENCTYKNPSNVNPVEITLSNGSRAILVHFDTKNNPTVDKHGIDAQIVSFDDGLTWSTPKILNFSSLSNNGGLIGPSIGIIQDNNIYFTTRFNGSTHLYWSDIHHLSNWFTAPRAVTQVDECSIAPLRNDSILANCRTANNMRAQVTFSLPQGLPSSLDWRSDLPDPNCQGSIIRVSGDEATNSSIFFLSNNNSTTQRANLTVRSSIDDGCTWDAGVLVWSKNSGYSQLVHIHDDKSTSRLSSSFILGLLFERGHNVSDPSAYHDDISFLNISYYSSSSSAAAVEIIERR